MSNLDKYLKKLIRKKVIPGASVAITNNDKILYEKHIGYSAISPDIEKLKKSTIYDLASITKPLITSLLLLKILEDEKIDISTKIKKFLPEFNNDIEIIDLITHSSGLPGWYPLFLKGNDYLGTIQKIKLNSNPKTKVEYSCVGFILLYFLIENISGSRFVDLAEQIIINPLNLTNTFLFDSKRVHENKKIAPTEIGNQFEKEKCLKINREATVKVKWRDSSIRGQTHDCNSFFLGGTAGNAGLFSNIKDLFYLTREIYPESATILKSESTELFWHNFTKFKKSHRTFGFKMNNSILRPAGRALDRESIGHNGFTGTSIWMEPESRMKYIILTNRVHPKVDENINFNRIRKKIHKLLKKEYLLAY